MADDWDEATRRDEKDDCSFYAKCLDETAKVEGRRGNRARNNCVPCKNCPRYQPVPPEPESAWKQRGYNPYSYP